jgi:hypothetical protein
VAGLCETLFHQFGQFFAAEAITPAAELTAQLDLVLLLVVFLRQFGTMTVP